MHRGWSCSASRSPLLLLGTPLAFGPGLLGKLGGGFTDPLKNEGFFFLGGGEQKKKKRGVGGVLAAAGGPREGAGGRRKNLGKGFCRDTV